MRADGHGTGEGLAGAVHFTGACYAVSWGLALALWMAVGPAEEPPGAPAGAALDDAQGAAFQAALLMMTMIPGVTAFVLRLIHRERLWTLASPFVGWRGFLHAYVLAAVFLGLSFGISWLVDLAGPNPELPEMRAQLARTAGWSNSEPFLVALSVYACTIAPLVLTPLVVVEEYGWRGYLLGRLLPRGRAVATVTAGFLWAVWQLPMVLLSRVYSSAPPWAAIPLALAVFTVLGTVLGVLALEFGSIWVPALAQSVAVCHTGIYLLFLSQTRPLLGGPTGVVGLVLAAAFLLWLHRRGRLATRKPAGEDGS